MGSAVPTMEVSTVNEETRTPALWNFHLVGGARQ